MKLCCMLLKNNESCDENTDKIKNNAIICV